MVLRLSARGVVKHWLMSGGSSRGTRSLVCVDAWCFCWWLGQTVPECCERWVLGKGKVEETFWISSRLQEWYMRTKRPRHVTRHAFFLYFVLFGNQRAACYDWVVKNTVRETTQKTVLWLQFRFWLFAGFKLNYEGRVWNRTLEISVDFFGLNFVFIVLITVFTSPWRWRLHVPL